MNQSSETQHLQRLSNSRLETLEFKIMELENTISELNEVVIQQYRDIDFLKAALQRLETRLTSDAEHGQASDPANEPPPPHY